MKKLYFFLIASFTTMAGIAQISVTSLTTAYTQNFDGLANSDTTNTTLPQGWLFSKSNPSTFYAADNGNNTSGNVYSYGTTGATERAFGSLNSNAVTPTIGAYFTNNSGGVITSITLSYYGEKWRLGALNRNDSLTFQYSTTATSLTNGTYTPFTNLSYAASASSGTLGPIDGNNTANRTYITATISNLNIFNGTTFYFKWTSPNVSGNDDGLAIDDVTINFNGNVQQPCTAPTAQPTVLTFNSVTTTSFNAAFTAASPVADEYLAVISTASTLSASPVNGTTYNTDDAIGNGIVAYRGSGASFSETALTPGTTYYVYIFSLNKNCSGSPLYLAANPLTGSQATTTPATCTAPVTQPTNIVVSSVTGSTVNGSFTASPTADSYLGTITTNIILGFTPTNGTSYPVGSTVGNNAKVIKFGPGNTFTATGLTPNTFYYLTFFAFNNANCISGPTYLQTSPLITLTSTNSNTSGIPTGYYDTVATQTCSPLKSILKWRTYPSLAPKTYGDLWTQYLVSDIKPREVGPGTSASVIWDIYSDNPTGTDPYNFTPGPVANGGQQDNGSSTSSEGVYYNREHSVPLSWFQGNTSNPGPATDYLHLYPTDKIVNAMRSNYIYGEVTSPTFTSQNGSKLGPNAFAGLTGTAFEPINEYKGDLARSFLYFITRYQDSMAIFLSGNTSTEVGQAFEPNVFPSADTPYLRLMRKWHAQDPVSQKEIDRNNAAYTYQGNRNPFIDHPEYVERIWGGSCTSLPVQLVSFKGALRGDKVVLTWEVKSEDNLQRYEIERSDNNRSFTSIGKVAATNSSQYQFTDDISSLTGRRLYYRLKKLDKDGRYSYSDVFTVHVPLSLSFSVYPNPVSGGVINVQFAKPVIAKAYLQLLDATGKALQQMPVSEGATNTSMNVMTVSKGAYLLRLVQPGSNTAVQIVQVQ